MVCLFVVACMRLGVLRDCCTELHQERRMGEMQQYDLHDGHTVVSRRLLLLMKLSATVDQHAHIIQSLDVVCSV